MAQIPSEEEAYEMMTDVFDKVLDSVYPIENLLELHRRTKDLLNDGNPNIKDRFFSYAKDKARELWRQENVDAFTTMIQRMSEIKRRFRD